MGSSLTAPGWDLIQDESLMAWVPGVRRRRCRLSGPHVGRMLSDELLQLRIQNADGNAAERTKEERNVQVDLHGARPELDPAGHVDPLRVELHLGVLVVGPAHRWFVLREAFLILGEGPV